MADMTYPIYRKPPSDYLLCQGDILDPECLRDNLRGHQDYFAERPYFYRYMIVTQTCDLDNRREMSDFIFLAVIRRMRDAFRKRQDEDERARNKTDSLLRDLYNHNYNKRGFFYLPKDSNQGIEEGSVVDLRVMFSLHKGHYPDLLKARLGAITDIYAAQLGHIAGYMFSRVATPGWEELNPGKNIKAQIKREQEAIHAHENERLKKLLLKNDGMCALCDCDKKASTYRWLRVRSDNDEICSQEHTLCTTHAEQYDKGTLPQNTVFR